MVGKSIKKDKKIVKDKKESSSEQLVDRKIYLRENLVEHLENKYPECDRKFNMNHVCEKGRTRGSFRTFMEGDFTLSDRKSFDAILQDLKKEGILLHVAGSAWARLK